MRPPFPPASMSFIFIVVISFLLTSATSERVVASGSSTSSEAKKKVPEVLHETASSNNVASEQRIIPNYHSLSSSEPEDDYSPSSKHRSPSEPRSRANVISTSSSESNTASVRAGLGSSRSRGYGYPHLIAPTLPPFISSRIDSYENDAIPRSPASIISVSDNPKRSFSHRDLYEDDDFEERSPKRRGSQLKKRKRPSSFFDEDDDDDDSTESLPFSPSYDGYSNYREPRYRNFADLDSGYKNRPRDYDVPISSYGSYGSSISSSSSPYPSEGSSSKSRPPTSPRDPYLSPSSKPIDGFYPKVLKDNSYSSLYGPSAKRNRGYKSSFDSSPPPPSRSYGSTSSSESSYGSPPHDDDFRLSHGGYVKSHKYNGGPKLHSDSSYKNSKGGSSYGSEFLARDNPIVGDTRKRLLDYAGASDIYMGEPDYLGGTARKPLFGGLEDDYYPYGRGRRFSVKDYLFDESKTVPVRAKRQVTQNTRVSEVGVSADVSASQQTGVARDRKVGEARLPLTDLQNLSRQKTASVAKESTKDTPSCASNSSLSICLADNEYPTEAVGRAVAENLQLLLQMSGGHIEVITKGNNNKKKPTSVDDEGKTLSVCASSKGDANPLRAKDTRGTWRIIVNEEGVQQSVFMDICRFPEEPCEFVPSAIATKCIQKFSTQTLLTYDADEGLVMHEFPIPSSCSCSVGRLIRIRSS